MSLSLKRNQHIRAKAYRAKALYLAGLTSVIFAFLQCSSSKELSKIKRTVYTIAEKTKRSDVLTQSAIVLSGYNFTIEYANSQATHPALRTNWRELSGEIPHENNSELIEFRDRAIIYFSVKGYQGSEVSLVSSSIQFEMEMRTVKSDNWTPVTPGPQFTDQYSTIVYQIQNRLRRLGYRFN